MRRYILSLFLFISYLNAFTPKTGDIVYFYNSKYLIDRVINSYFQRNISHSAVFEGKDKAVSISIEFIGDKGIIEYDDTDEILNSAAYIILRPKMRHGRYMAYQRCVKRNIALLKKSFYRGEYVFDWAYRKGNKNLFCAEWVEKIARKCLPASYFVKNDERFPFFDVFNLKKFKIYSKNIKIKGR